MFMLFGRSLMNTQEEQQLIRFLNGLVQTKPPDIDFQAQALIDQAFAKQPHAAYLLTQRSLALSMAVEAAQRRIAQLEEAASSPVSSNQWGRQAGLERPQQARLAGQGLAAQTQAPVQAQAAQSSWSQGLMGSLLGAAAGVMIGQALWQGMNNMFTQPADTPGDGFGSSHQSLDAGSGQQAQSDWGSGLSVDEGAFDGGEGDDWI
ncbi:MAG: DUF2076 family protein [Alphaproteobacteria bacterium]|nr:DUF2076 family protein [Betaproteobacteria bacterium]NCW80789.1 DUF2076 family protein [Betaproteobacteria bacterium]NDF50083.1 DUF2076 family protein [Betaproteobacteria bacterium]NDG05280.1 DUF2076 family protein [Alphaproteobacteria bacterium]